jgi:crossover junction endodeoxyribonuclease RuvC
MESIDDHMLKLQRIFEKTVNLIDNYHPDCLAIEAPFYGKNIQVMLNLAARRA